MVPRDNLHFGVLFIIKHWPARILVLRAILVKYFYIVKISYSFVTLLLFKQLYAMNKILLHLYYLAPII